MSEQDHPHTPQFVSKDTFTVLWETLKTCQASEQHLYKQLEQSKSQADWLAYEAARLGKLAKEYSDRADALKAELGRVTEDNHSLNGHLKTILNELTAVRLDLKWYVSQQAVDRSVNDERFEALLAAGKAMRDSLAMYKITSFVDGGRVERDAFPELVQTWDTALDNLPK
jgi:chromosome segregation ATPase